MGKELAERFDCAEQIYKTADQVLGFPLSRICFEGTKEELNKTEITKAAVLTTSIATFMVLKEKGLLPVMAAGLSLGEYSALVVSGALQFEDACTKYSIILIFCIYKKDPLQSIPSIPIMIYSQFHEIEILVGDLEWINFRD